MERFTKKDWQKQIKNSLELKKVVKKKGDKLYVQWKGYDSSFNSWVEPKSLGGRVKVDLDLFNYAIKSDLKMQQVLINQNLQKKLI